MQIEMTGNTAVLVRGGGFVKRPNCEGIRLNASSEVALVQNNKQRGEGG